MVRTALSSRPLFHLQRLMGLDSLRGLRQGSEPVKRDPAKRIRPEVLGQVNRLENSRKDHGQSTHQAHKFNSWPSIMGCAIRNPSSLEDAMSFT